MRFDPDYRPYVPAKCIYIIPLCSDPLRYRVLTPARLSKMLLDLLMQDRLVIRQFRGCPDEAVAAIKAQLLRGCGRVSGRYATRTNQLIVLGAALFVLGVINCTFPDPLPLIDEILMMGGGAAAGLGGYISRKKNLPLLEDKAGKAEKHLEKIECIEDPMLSGIYQSIRTKSKPDVELSNGRAIDRIEAESEWLFKYLDLQQLLDSKQVPFAELQELLWVLEQKITSSPANKKLRRKRDELAARWDLSTDAFSVYAEFYRRGKQILAEQDR